MSGETARIARMWASADSSKPETLVAVIEHIRAALSEGMCPMCLSPVIKRPRRDGNHEIAFSCTGCPLEAPLHMVDEWPREIGPATAPFIAGLLKLVWMKVHGCGR